MRPFLLLVLFIAAPAFAQVPEDVVQTYLDQSIVDEQALAIAEQLTGQITSQASQFPEPARAPFLKIYGDGFSDEALNARLAAYFEAEGDADSLRAVMDWEQQPLAARMLALVDSSSNDPAGQQAVQLYTLTGRLGELEVTPEREAQMDRYLAITDAKDSVVNLYLEILLASATSMQAVSDQEPPPADSIRAAMRPQLDAVIGGMVRGGTLYAFRDVSNADFEAYLDLLAQPAARYAALENTAAIQHALVGAITDAGEAFSKRLLELDAEGKIDLDELRAQQAGQGG